MSWKDTVQTIRGSADEEERTYAEVVEEEKKEFFSVMERVFSEALTNNNAQPILDSIAQFGKVHSVANCAAIIGQAPGATIVKRYEEWQKEQHPVKSSGAGIIVLSQVPDTTPPKFTPYRVFDVSETKYRPNPAKEMNCDILNSTLVSLLTEAGIKTTLVSEEFASDVKKESNIIYLSDTATNEEGLIAFATAYSNHFASQKGLSSPTAEYATYIFIKRTNIPIPADVFDLRTTDSIKELKKDIFNARKIANEMTASVRDKYLLQVQQKKKTAYRS